MGLAQDLIEQANHLATRDVAGRPRQASLRRAVSAAYYALFHFLVDQASRIVVGGQDVSLRALVSRGFDHSSMRKVAAQFASGGLPPKLMPALERQPIPSDLRIVAEAFTTLQKWRHDADYDLLRRFERDQVLRLISQSQQAMALWPGIQNSRASRVFLFALLVSDQVHE